METDRDEQGAITWIGLAMSVFLCSLVTYVSGLARTLYYRTHLQDAADVAAFSAAVAEARGMNLIVLINLVMMALLAVLVALMLIQTLASIALIAVTSLLWLMPALSPAVPLLQTVRSTASKAHGKLEPDVMDALSALHTAAEAVRVSVPVVAQAKVIATVANRHGPPVTGAFALPARLTLPVESDDFEVLCKEAQDFVAGLVLLPIAPILPEPIEDTVHGALSDLAGAGTAWYCGDSDAEPPTTTLRYDRALPVLDEQRACLKASERETTPQSTALCDEATRVNAEARADETTGACVHDCRPGGAYDRAVRQARVECAPHDGRWHPRNTALANFVWQERRGTRRYKRTDAGLVVVAEELQSFRERSGRDKHRHPCGAGGWLSSVYNTESGTFAAPAPVCAAETAHRHDPLTVDVIEVTHILACTEAVEERRSVSDFTKPSRLESGDSDWKQKRSPMRVVSDLALGDDDFQVRATALGDEPTPGARRSVAIAAGGGGQSAVSQLTSFERFAVAQAEFFYEPPGKSSLARSRWMWNRGWRARLKRVRLSDTAGPSVGPASAEPPALAESVRGRCMEAPGGNGTACSAAESQLATPGLEVLH